MAGICFLSHVSTNERAWVKYSGFEYLIRDPYMAGSCLASHVSAR